MTPRYALVGTTAGLVVGALFVLPAGTGPALPGRAQPAEPPCQLRLRLTRRPEPGVDAVVRGLQTLDRPRPALDARRAGLSGVAARVER